MPAGVVDVRSRAASGIVRQAAAGAGRWPASGATALRGAVGELRANWMRVPGSWSSPSKVTGTTQELGGFAGTLGVSFSGSLGRTRVRRRAGAAQRRLARVR